MRVEGAGCRVEGVGFRVEGVWHLFAIPCLLIDMPRAPSSLLEMMDATHAVGVKRCVRR